MYFLQDYSCSGGGGGWLSEGIPKKFILALDVLLYNCTCTCMCIFMFILHTHLNVTCCTCISVCMYTIHMLNHVHYMITSLPHQCTTHDQFFSNINQTMYRYTCMYYQEITRIINLLHKYIIINLLYIHVHYSSGYYYSTVCSVQQLHCDSNVIIVLYTVLQTTGDILGSICTCNTEYSVGYASPRMQTL